METLIRIIKTGDDLDKLQEILPTIQPGSNDMIFAVSYSAFKKSPAYNVISMHFGVTDAQADALRFLRLMEAMEAETHSQ